MAGAGINRADPCVGGDRDDRPGLVLASPPLGAAGLAEDRTVIEVAPGVQHVRIKRGGGSAPDPATAAWTIDVGFAATESAGGRA